jgi:uncharacterized BrkB/YihY/UPF0761 family membrane protein
MPRSWAASSKRVNSPFSKLTTSAGGMSDDMAVKPTMSAKATVQAFDFLIFTALISAMFAAIYKILPDTPITWRDVAVGAVVTTLLFDVGKYLIALFIG